MSSACGERKAGNQSNSYRAGTEAEQEANHCRRCCHPHVLRSTMNSITLKLNPPTPTQNLPAQAGRPHPLLTHVHFWNTVWLCSVSSHTSSDTSSKKAIVSNTKSSRNLSRNTQFINTTHSSQCVTFCLQWSPHNQHAGVTSTPEIFSPLVLAIC